MVFQANSGRSILEILFNFKRQALFTHQAMQLVSVKHDEMSLKDRVKKLRKENHLSQVQLASQLGVSQSVISLIESGQASVSIEILKKLSEQFNISCDWLIYGKDKYVRLTTSNAFIPMVNIEAKAGYIENHTSEDFIEALDLYKIPGFTSGNFRLFEVEGDSMIPAITPHDKIICERAEDHRSLAEGTLNVIVTQKDIVVKRTYYSEQGDKLILKSDNADYKDMTIALDQVLEIWEVKAKLTNTFVSQSFASHSRIEKLEKDMQGIKHQLSSLLSKFNGGSH